MREHSRDRYNHGDSRKRSRDHEDRSREHWQPIERSREQNQKSQWSRNERKANYPQTKYQQKEKNAVQSVVKVNRKQICPFLVRIFYSINKENAFGTNIPLPQTEIFLHLWMDCSLRELAELLRAHIPSIRTKQRFQFWRVYTQQGKSELSKQQLGSVMMHRKFDRSEDRYLQNSKFKIGDHIDISINYK